MEQMARDNGIVSKHSQYSIEETVDRLEGTLKAKGMTIFARIDQREAARGVGLDMRPTVLIIFGSPQAGTPLMVAYPSLAIDLPLKLLVWKSDDGPVLVSYNSPAFLKERHGLRQEPFKPVEVLVEAALK